MSWIIEVLKQIIVSLLIAKPPSHRGIRKSHSFKVAVVLYYRAEKSAMTSTMPPYIHGAKIHEAKLRSFDVQNLQI
jgi:hypothetical protein